MAAVLEDRSGNSRPRHHRAPRLRVRTRIGDGEFVLQRVGIDAREAFDHARVGGRSLQARLAPEVDRVDDERVAFPVSA